MKFFFLQTHGKWIKKSIHMVSKPHQRSEYQPLHTACLTLLSTLPATPLSATICCQMMWNITSMIATYCKTLVLENTCAVHFIVLPAPTQEGLAISRVVELGVGARKTQKMCRTWVAPAPGSGICTLRQFASYGTIGTELVKSCIYCKNKISKCV